MDYMVNTITEQLPTVIQSHFQAHIIDKDTVNKNVDSALKWEAKFNPMKIA